MRRRSADALRIGTRGSRLALRQAHRVRDLLRAAHPGLSVEIVTIRTAGDRNRHAPLGRDPGLFTKEIERSLLAREVDVAVHSLKDLPTELSPGLALVAVPEREDPWDVLVGRPGRVEGMDDLEPGVVVGTSSPRRRGQLLASVPGLEIVPLRGNVPTRLRRVEEEGGPDAIVLALAGLRRLGLEESATEILPLEVMVPAPGQGALGVETREDDRETRRLVSRLDDAPVRAAVRAERSFLRRLEGGCTVPAGALGTVEPDGMLRLEAIVTDLEGVETIRGTWEQRVEDAETLGIAVAEEILAAGAEGILARLREGKA